MLCLLTAGGCNQASPKATVLGRWIETPESMLKKFRRDGYSHEVELFKDGTGASILKNPAYVIERSTTEFPAGESTTSFTWSLSDDGQRIKTEAHGEAREARRTFVQRIVKLTSTELETDGPGQLAGSYVKDK